MFSMEASSCPGLCGKLRQRLWDCQQRREFCDIILETDAGDQVWAHRVIISAVSPVLHNMLMDRATYIQDKTYSVEAMRVSGIQEVNLQDIVRFAYLGNVESIRMDTIAVWGTFQIPEPIRLCEQQSPESKAFSLPATEIKTEEDSLTEDYLDYEDKEHSSPAEAAPPSNLKSTMVKSEVSLENNNSKPQERKDRKRKLPALQYTSVDSGSETAHEDDACPDDEDFTPPKRRRGRPKKTQANTLSKPIRRVKKPQRSPPKRKSALKNTLTGRHEEKMWPTQCTTCNVEFDSVDLYKKHRHTMHKPQHTCMDCAKTFIQAKQLKAHRIAEHYKEGLPEPNWHFCEVEGCNYRTIYKYALYTHSFTHTKEKVICETCGALFSRQQSLRKHVLTAHGGGPTHKCDECDKAFYAPSMLKAHKDRIHKKELRVLCDQCPFMGFDKEAVAAHAFRRHGVPLPGAKTSHTCPYCGYQSPSGSNMRDHIERHEPEDYKCDQCDSVFPCRRDLRAHKSLNHTQRKRVTHPCPYEGCKFVSKYGPSVLKQHVSRMHEQKDYKPWECSECAYRTNVKGNLHLHMRNVHKLSPEINQRRVTKVQADGSMPEPDTSELPDTSDSYTKEVDPNNKTISTAPMRNTEAPFRTVSTTDTSHLSAAGSEAPPSALPNTLTLGFPDYLPVVYPTISTEQPGGSMPGAGPSTYHTLSIQQINPRGPPIPNTGMPSNHPQYDLNSLPSVSFGGSQLTQTQPL